MSRFTFQLAPDTPKEVVSIIQNAADALEKHSDHSARELLERRIAILEGSDLPDYLTAFDASTILTTFGSWIESIDARSQVAA